jgi:hypothetical protein
MEEYEMSETYNAHGRAGNACNVKVGLFEVKRSLCRVI